MQTLKIVDGYGFIGIANLHKYQSFVAEDWDFELLKVKLIEEMNAHQLLFWATGFGNFRNIKIDDKASDSIAFREEKGVIEVTSRKLHLVNYESLTMAAQSKKVKLPEAHLADLVVELDNGKYMVNIRQMYNPDAYNFDAQNIDFEIILRKIDKNIGFYVNNVEDIFWCQ
jgi:hypothetical protein